MTQATFPEASPRGSMESPCSTPRGWFGGSTVLAKGSRVGALWEHYASTVWAKVGLSLHKPSSHRRSLSLAA